MSTVSLLRCLAIGLDDSRTISERINLIKSGDDLEKLVSDETIRNAKETAKWISVSKDCGIWWCNDPSFPDFSPIEKRLPFMLFYRGTKPSSNQKRIAMIGTRHCDYLGLQKSFALGLEAACNGYNVVTGLAQGCDQASAEGAVAAFEIVKDACPCYAVLGCGLEVDYPKLSSNLKKKIIQTGGAVISRFPPFDIPKKYNFPNRNVTVAAMSDFCVAVQAPEKSGTLITCDLALQMGKDVFVSSEGLGESTSRRGSTVLVSEGAYVIDSLSEILDVKNKIGPCSQDVEKSVRFGSRHYMIKQVN